MTTTLTEPTLPELESGFLDRIKYRSLLDVTEDQPPFLIEGWLSKVATSLAGEPKAGKTTLTAAAVAALLRGDPDFVGLRVNEQLSRAAFGLTDAGAGVELKRRFTGLGLDHQIRVFDPRALSGDEWPALADWLDEDGVGLYVHDNIVTGLLPGEDIAEPKTASDIVNRFRELEARGIPILALTHPAKGGKEGGGVASSPMGGRAFGAWPRSVSYLRRPKSAHGSTLEIRANMGPDIELPLTVTFDGDVPTFARDTRPRAATSSEDQPKRRNARNTNEVQWTAAINRALAEQPAKSVKGLSEWMFEQYPSLGAAETIRNKLKGSRGPLVFDRDRKEFVRASDL